MHCYYELKGKMLLVKFLLLSVIFACGLGYKREPTVYQSPVDKTPGDNGFKIKINESPEKYDPGQVYTYKPTSSHWAKDEAAWGYLGGEVNLTCEVIAEPPATFQWFWQKKLMHGGLVHNTTNKSVRQIQLTDAKMFGNYMCQAKNAIGTLDKLFILQQGVRPESPDFIELRGKNSDLLDIGVQRKEKEKVPADMKPLGYGVQYRPIGEQQWNFHYFTLNKDNSYPLRDLKHGTAYEVRVATKNLAGYSVYTNASVFETLHSQTSASETTSSSYLIYIGVAALLSW